MKTVVFRLLAYGLAVVLGAALMFAVDRAWTDSSPAASTHGAAMTAQPATDALPVLEPVATVITPKEEVVRVPPETVAIEAAAESPEVLRVTGVTEPVPGRFAKLPLATNQPVAFVDVKLGDRVKKGWQVFSHWESPERLQAVKSELERTKKQLEVAKTRAVAATQAIERLRKLKGNVTAQEVEDAESLATIRQGELESAQLAVAASDSHFRAMEFEFNQAFVTSPIDGIVAAVDIHPGERRQATGTFRGVVVLDARVLNCRCLLTKEQLASVERIRESFEANASSTVDKDRAVADPFPVIIESDQREWNAQLLTIGILADVRTGQIPVILEVQNPDEKLRSGIQVNVRFGGRSAASGSAPKP